MDVKTFEDIRRAHDHFGEMFAARIQALASGSAGGAVDPAKERAAQLEAVQQKIQAMAAARDAAMQRFDGELERYRRQARDLEQANVPDRPVPKATDAEPVTEHKTPAPSRARKKAASVKSAKTGERRKSSKT